MKITMYELLGMIINSEEVPLIKYENIILHWNKEKSRFEDKDSMNTLYEIYFSNLNDEIEILEEKKKIPEKIEEEEIEISMAIGEQICANKINEIIDYLESKGDE